MSSGYLEESKADEALVLLKEFDSISLTRFRVVGNYVRYDEGVRERLKDMKQKVIDGLQALTKGQENYLIWGPIGSGKSYLVQQIAQSLNKNACFRELNLAELDEQSFRSKLAKLKEADRPLLCFIDEVDSKPSEPWPYEILLPQLEPPTPRAIRTCFILAGSGGSDLSQLKKRMSLRHKGNDLLSRIPPGNEYVVSLLNMGDKLLVALSQLTIAARELGFRVCEVEKLALCYIALNSRFEKARQLRDLAVNCVRRMPKGEDRIKYDNLFSAGDPERFEFWEKWSGKGLTDSYTSVEADQDLVYEPSRWQSAKEPTSGTRKNIVGIKKPLNKKWILGSYSSGDFEETRPILPGTSKMSIAEKKQVFEEYNRKRLDYERQLVERYHAENLIVWGRKRYPVSVLLKVQLKEENMVEQFDLDASCRIVKYRLPLAIEEWDRDALLTFMKEDPLVKNEEFPDFPNSDIAHFEEFDFSNNKLTIWYQKATFYDYTVTMLAMDVLSTSKRKKLRDVLEPGGRELGWRLRPVKDSLSAGTLGVNCFVITSDGKFVVVWRSDKVSNAKNSFAPSASGLLRWTHVLPNPSGAIFRAATKHLEEEMNVQSYEITRPEFLGLTRELERAGHTETHFFLKVKLDFEALKTRSATAAHRKEYTHYIPVEPHDLTGYISKAESSPSLRGGIYLLNAFYGKKLGFREAKLPRD